MEDRQLLREYLSEEFTLNFADQACLDELRAAFANHINNLLQDRLHEVVTLLYRIDVSESGLRNMLGKYPDQDAGSIIAGMIIERQMQKIETRRQFRQTGEIPEDEKW